MIKSKRPNTVDEYGDIGFIQAKVGDEYKNIDHIYDSDGNVIFQQGYLNEYQGADDFSIPAIGKPLVDYTIYGNTKQDGFPTPDSPIEPEFVGDLVSIELDEPLRAVDSGNCDTIDLATKTYTKRITDEIILTGDEDWHSCGERSKTFYFQHRPYRKPVTNCVGILDSVITYDGGYINGYTNWSVQFKFHGGDVSYTVDDLKAYLKEKYLSGNPIKVWYCVVDSNVETQTLFIPDGLTGVIEGTVTQSGTPTPDNPIEPVFNGTLLPNGKYQVYKTYKIPISSGGQTKNIYLGQVPTTRKIRKLVLTGEENFRRASNGCFYWTGGITDYSRLQNVDMCRCTHFGSQPLVGGSSSVTTNNIAFYYSTVTSEFYCAARNISSADDFKAFLAQQYAAGTPVTVWYVLAEPEVGIVNEPLCRIGDYADSIAFEQAGVEIPTLKKPNTTVIDVETEVEPSEVDVTYRATYRPSYQLFLAANGDSFEAKDGQSLYIGGNP